jgi:hypothetical protein
LRHISAQVDEDGVINGRYQSEDECEVEFSCMATRVKVRMPGGFRAPKGRRGKVNGFTDASRRRLIDKLNRVQAHRLPVFATLTYPGKWPSNPRAWKRDIDNFSRALGRLGRLGAVWKLEPQQRGAPHFHLLVWGVSHLGRFRAWLSKTWYRIVDSGDVRHLRAGTQAGQVRSRRGVMWYAAKYMTKAVLPDAWAEPGRFWGVIGGAAIPWGIEVKRVIPAWMASKLKRWLRRASGFRRISHLGQTFYLDGPEMWLVRLDDMLALGP